MAETFEIREYTESGRSPFAEWFDDLDPVTAARVDRYVRRLEAGNFGAAKALRDGVFELRLDFGPGVPRVLRTRRPNGHHIAGWREQATAGRRYCRRYGTLETVQTSEVTNGTDTRL